MSRLLLSSGEAFATGEHPCSIRPVAPGNPTARLFVPIRISGKMLEAVVDTGGAFLVLGPEMAAELGVSGGMMMGRSRIFARGDLIDGALYRYSVMIPAEVGQPLTFEATVFAAERWPLPPYVGFHACLDRVRHAVDPLRETFFFGES